MGYPFAPAFGLEQDLSRWNRLWEVDPDEPQARVPLRQRISEYAVVNSETAAEAIAKLLDEDVFRAPDAEAVIESLKTKNPALEPIVEFQLFSTIAEHKLFRGQLTDERGNRVRPRVRARAVFV